MGTEPATKFRVVTRDGRRQRRNGVGNRFDAYSVHLWTSQSDLSISLNKSDERLKFPDDWRTNYVLYFMTRCDLQRVSHVSLDVSKICPKTVSNIHSIGLILCVIASEWRRCKVQELMKRNSWWWRSVTFQTEVGRLDTTSNFSWLV